MPRLDNSADSPQPHQYRLLYVDFSCVTGLVSQNLSIIEAIPALQGHVSPMAYIIRCLRFTLIVRLIVSSHWKAIPILKLRTTRKTRYRWLARPYPTGTFTLQDASSLLDALTLTISGFGRSCQNPLDCFGTPSMGVN